MDAIDRVTERTRRHVEERKVRHRTDVAYVQAHHPELAAVLSEFVKVFGRDQVRYRVVLNDKARREK